MKAHPYRVLSVTARGIGGSREAEVALTAITCKHWIQDFALTEAKPEVEALQLQKLGRDWIAFEVACAFVLPFSCGGSLGEQLP